ncbi:MAG: hypothetical protein P4L46_06860 [Fimbriimonas sp.]|nr:hypothetical protein [Fimbriimonas sp.]
MKRIAVALGLACCGSTWAQIPDIRVRLDATISYIMQPHTTPLVNFYDVMGRPSILGLSFFTDQGFRVNVTEKLQHIPGDAGNDLFDEYYIEDENIWRVGKQYLPFGGGHVLHESAVAVRGDTNLIVEGLPVTMAFCDSGNGLDYGLIGRLGSTVGVSAAVGRNFGTAGTSLTDVRRPEDAPGKGHGWKQVFGLDASKRFLGHWSLRAEAVSFRYGETSSDRDTAVLDVGLSLDPKRSESTTLAWSQIAPDHHNYWRLGGSYAMSRNVTFEPMIRFRGDSLFQVVAQVRIRI